MKPGHLSRYFTGVASKRLSLVEVSRTASRQHEFNGVDGLRKILGRDRRSFSARLLWLTDEEEQCVAADTSVTWYDAREGHSTRSEYRMYFPSTVTGDMASAGDLLAVARRPDDSLLILLVQRGTTVESQITWLFGLPETDLFHVKEIAGSADPMIGYGAGLVLEYLGVEFAVADDEYLDELIRLNDGGFPGTEAFSIFSRQTMALSALDDPDAALLGWMEQEERLFRVLEHHIVGERLKSGFTDVNEFVTYSLTVQNRRKSRAGYALENHTDAILHAHELTHSRNPVTENYSRPDFVFPGRSQYADAAFPSQRLSMLAAKSTCKERWRQVLAEAARITDKHLLTLEPGISHRQTDEMKANHLTLVVPAGLHDTFSDVQRGWLMSVSEFLVLARERQGSEGFDPTCR